MLITSCMEKLIVLLVSNTYPGVAKHLFFISSSTPTILHLRFYSLKNAG